VALSPSTGNEEPRACLLNLHPPEQKSRILATQYPAKYMTFQSWMMSGVGYCLELIMGSEMEDNRGFPAISHGKLQQMTQWIRQGKITDSEVGY
jgi:hypothetical protein